METPYYEIDEAKLNQDIAGLHRAMASAWGPNSIAACSVKTNSLPWLLNHFREHGFYAEVVSAEEYDLVMRLGFEPSHVIYNGPIKDKDVFFKVLRDGGRVNLDSSQEIAWLENTPGIWKVGLRVNVDFHKLVPDEVPADEEGSRFGYSEENGELAAVIGRLRRLPNVKIAGLHLHSSTKTRSVKAYAAVADFAGRIASKYELTDGIEYIDMGGGFYGGVPGKPTFDDYLPAIADGTALKDSDYDSDYDYGESSDHSSSEGEKKNIERPYKGLKQYFDPGKVTLILEPGVSMVSSSFSFVTSVQDVKRIGEHIYVVIDGSRLDLNPQVTRRWYPHHVRYYERGNSAEADPSQACLHEDQLQSGIIARQRDIENAEHSRCTPQAEGVGSRQTLPSQWVVGATCMEYDRLFEMKDEPELQIGDQVIFDRAGGYTICLTPLFIHYFPAVYVKKVDGSVFTAREPWTNEEFLQKNSW